jgi:hypothetical protein
MIKNVKCQVGSAGFGQEKRYTIRNKLLKDRLMRKIILLLLLLVVQTVLLAQEYYPEGTKWTEIRLDTQKYDSWYSKVGNEWVANYETIEYYVHGEYVNKERDDSNIFKKVYTNGPEWTDSLTLLIQEVKYNGHNSVLVSVLSHGYDEGFVLWPGEAYQFDWGVGKGLYYKDITSSNTTGMGTSNYYYGIIEEIKEGYFGGIRPLRYVDLDGNAPEDETGLKRNISTNGGRIIQGIGITEWNDGECLFGPPNPYSALTGEMGQRHYRAMLVHFERNGEMLYDVWPEKKVTSEMMSTRKIKKTIVNTLYNLQGHRLSNPPQKGIYIHDGKKRPAR